MIFTGRPSPLPDWAAWQRSKRRNFLPPMIIHRHPCSAAARWIKYGAWRMSGVRHNAERHAFLGKKFHENRDKACSEAERSSIAHVESTEIPRAPRGSVVSAPRSAAMGLFTKDIKTMDDLFLHGLKDIYYAEQQITKALPKMIDQAANRVLRRGPKTLLD